MRSLSRATLIALAAASALAAAACNTVAGAGRDVQSVGHAITNAADDARDEMKDGSP